jgi:hypothetical protein
MAVDLTKQATICSELGYVVFSTIDLRDNPIARPFEVRVPVRTDVREKHDAALG